MTNRWEYALEAEGGVHRWLISRLVTTGEKGETAWKRVARFDSYNDAEWVLTLIRRGLEKP